MLRQSMTKKCSKCHLELDESSFYRRKDRKIGYTSKCSKCSAKQSKMSREKNKEIIKARKQEIYLKNKEHILAQKSEYYKKNKDKINKKKKEIPKEKLASEKRKAKYGITTEQFNLLVEKQDNKCAICGIDGKNTHKKVLCIDHDHITKHIRGLLCDTCNRAIGMLKDSPELLEKAQQYLIKNISISNYHYKIVEVFWLDAESSSGWESHMDDKYTPPLICTVGFLIHENESSITISSTAGMDGGSNARMHIPKRMIEQMNFMDINK